jgi:tripartite-type tricarboxylate transporter receptor subunit TctC
MILRTLLLAVAALTMALLQSVLPSQAQTQPPATDQTWPQRPVKFIVPLGAGSGVDITARLLTSKLSARWGKPVVIENRPGGDGIVALSAFTSARDNHTLLFSPSSAFAAHPFLYEKLPYDPRDLVPIARVTSTLVGISRFSLRTEGSRIRCRP